MRVPRVRFTIRRMMIAVAVVAVLFGADRTLRRRWAHLKRMALHQADLQQSEIFSARGFRSTARMYRVHAAQHEREAEMLERSAKRPGPTQKVAGQRAAAEHEEVVWYSENADGFAAKGGRANTKAAEHARRSRELLSRWW